MSLHVVKHLVGIPNPFEETIMFMVPCVPKGLESLCGENATAVVEQDDSQDCYTVGVG